MCNDSVLTEKSKPDSRDSRDSMMTETSPCDGYIGPISHHSELVSSFQNISSQQENISEILLAL